MTTTFTHLDETFRVVVTFESVSFWKQNTAYEVVCISNPAKTSIFHRGNKKRITEVLRSDFKRSLSAAIGLVKDADNPAPEEVRVNATIAPKLAHGGIPTRPLPAQR